VFGEAASLALHAGTLYPASRLPRAADGADDTHLYHFLLADAACAERPLCSVWTAAGAVSKRVWLVLDDTAVGVLADVGGAFGGGGVFGSEQVEEAWGAEGWEAVVEVGGWDCV